ncbi:MAG: gfo/Idh/MocA family oxidoreductase, partial [Planctomycetota bacterium]|nr:gfo/Idh/MocA family oxidoreductase [Planctomycetota bacterium]
FRDDQETPDTLVANYSFGEKTIVWEHRLWSNHTLEGRSAAAAFYGERGTLVVDRGGWKIYDSSNSATSEASDLLGMHLRNFIDCVKHREQPIANLAIGHVSSTLCHLGNIAYRVGHEVQFDAKTGAFGADVEANALLSSPHRDQWTIG